MLCRKHMYQTTSILDLISLNDGVAIFDPGLSSSPRIPTLSLTKLSAVRQRKKASYNAERQA